MRDGKTMLLGLSDGCLYSISWKGEVTLIFSGIFSSFDILHF